MKPQLKKGTSLEYEMADFDVCDQYQFTIISEKPEFSFAWRIASESEEHNAIVNIPLIILKNADESHTISQGDFALKDVINSNKGLPPFLISKKIHAELKKKGKSKLIYGGIKYNELILTETTTHTVNIKDKQEKIPVLIVKAKNDREKQEDKLIIWDDKNYPIVIKATMFGSSDYYWELKKIGEEKINKKKVAVKKRVLYEIGENRTIYLEGTLYGMVDTVSSKDIFHPKYIDIKKFREKLALVKKETKKKNKYKYGFIDVNGKELSGGLKYDVANEFSDGLAFVIVDLPDMFAQRLGQKGDRQFIDTTGKTVFALSNDIDGILYGFHNGFCRVLKLDTVDKINKHGFIDKTGKPISKLEYDDADDFEHGIALVKKGNYFGYINAEGKEIIPIEHQTKGTFYENKIIIMNKEGAQVEYDMKNNK
ncbi:MAG: WG repeat-containing protein [Bacteroidetes bacterium]|nr:WG repeat-containing protein [Bacteroidota bacterium]